MTQFKEIPANKRSMAIRRPVYGIGINDADYMVKPTINGKTVKCPYYVTWNSMLKRCYDKKYHQVNPTYKNCTVSDEWINFSAFKQWMQTQEWKGKDLDKDILVLGNKVYSHKTCVFISPGLNRLLIDNNANRGKCPQGVSFYKPSGKFMASCSVDGKKKYLGSFTTAEEAFIAYKQFKSYLIIKIAETQPKNIKKALHNYVNWWL